MTNSKDEAYEMGIDELRSSNTGFKLQVAMLEKELSALQQKITRLEKAIEEAIKISMDTSGGVGRMASRLDDIYSVLKQALTNRQGEA